MKDKFKVSSFYSIFDRETKTFGPIQEYSSHVAAIRSFKRSFKEAMDMVQDFDLYCIGDRNNISDAEDISFALSLSFGWHIPELVLSGSTYKSEYEEDK